VITVAWVAGTSAVLVPALLLLIPARTNRDDEES
jgi:hypothetical protein